MDFTWNEAEQIRLNNWQVRYAQIQAGSKLYNSGLSPLTSSLKPHAVTRP